MTPQESPCARQATLDTLAAQLTEVKDRIDGLRTAMADELAALEVRLRLHIAETTQPKDARHA